MRLRWPEAERIVTARIHNPHPEREKLEKRFHFISLNQRTFDLFSQTGEIFVQ